MAQTVRAVLAGCGGISQSWLKGAQETLCTKNIKNLALVFGEIESAEAIQRAIY